MGMKTGGFSRELSPGGRASVRADAVAAIAPAIAAV
jgi:hypothetical protein